MDFPGIRKGDSTLITARCAVVAANALGGWSSLGHLQESLQSYIYRRVNAHDRAAWWALLPPIQLV